MSKSEMLIFIHSKRIPTFDTQHWIVTDGRTDGHAALCIHVQGGRSPKLNDTTLHFCL